MPLTLCEFGCVATTAELLEFLKQDSVVDIYQHSRGIVRIRRGRYACAHLSAEQLAALRCGGVLDCVSALEAEGADVGCCDFELTALHVRFRRGDRWAASRITEAPVPVVVHWHAWRTPPRTAITNRTEYVHRRPVIPLSHIPPAEALAQALGCVAPDRAWRLIAGLEADGLLSAEQVGRIIAASPRRTRCAEPAERRDAPASGPLRPSRVGAGTIRVEPSIHRHDPSAGLSVRHLSGDVETRVRTRTK